MSNESPKEELLTYVIILILLSVTLFSVFNIRDKLQNNTIDINSFDIRIFTHHNILTNDSSYLYDWDLTISLKNDNSIIVGNLLKENITNVIEQDLIFYIPKNITNLYFYKYTIIILLNYSNVISLNINDFNYTESFNLIDEENYNCCKISILGFDNFIIQCLTKN